MLKIRSSPVIRVARRAFRSIPAPSLACTTPSALADAVDRIHTLHHAAALSSAAQEMFGPARSAEPGPNGTNARYALLSARCIIEHAHVDVPAKKQSTITLGDGFPAMEWTGGDIQMERVHKILCIPTSSGDFRVEFGWITHHAAFTRGCNADSLLFRIFTPASAGSTPSPAACDISSTYSELEGASVDPEAPADPSLVSSLETLLQAVRTDVGPAAPTDVPGSGSKAEPIPEGVLTSLTADELAWWLSFSCTYPSILAFNRLSRTIPFENTPN